MENSISQFYNLPDELIIMIFARCDIACLKNLASTCRKFSLIIRKEDHVWREASRDVFGSNMSSPSMIKRCKPILAYRNRCLFSKMWGKSLGKMTKIAQFKKCMPWIVLERDHLYLSKGDTVLQYKRSVKGNVCLQPIACVTPCDDDISRFATNEHEVVCAGRDGKIARLDKQRLHMINSFVGHPADILAIDTKKDLIVSGCRDALIKIWKPFPHKTECKAAIKIKNTILSMAIMPSNSTLVVGTPGTRGVHPLQFFDIECCTHIFNFGGIHRNGAGILDILPETFHTFLTCGYDTTLQLWDIRCPEKSVGIWYEPFDNCLYCVQSDHNNTIITGASRHASFLVWDKRVLYDPVRTYYTPVKEMSKRRRISSTYYKGPIYSATFDASHIFVALDRLLMQYSYMDPFDNLKEL